jgi:hypothetical protein
MTNYDESKTDCRQQFDLVQLLLEADLITVEQLKGITGVNSDGRTDRLGAKLVIAGFISHSELHDATYVQGLLHDEWISLQNAIDILLLVRKEDISADEAIARLQLKIDEGESNLSFEGLLVEAGILTKEELNDVIARASVVSVPLERILETSGLANSDLLALVRDTEMALRWKAISQAQAVSALAKLVKKPGAADRSSNTGATAVPAGANESLDKAPPSTVIPKRDLGFGDFLVMCGLLQQADLESTRKMCDGTTFGIETAVRKIHRTKGNWIDLASKCFHQYRQQKATVDQAIYAFDFCRRMVESGECSMSDAVKTLASQSGITLL